jgi:hypothetical protein
VLGSFEIDYFKDWTHRTGLKRRHVGEEPVKISFE